MSLEAVRQQLAAADPNPAAPAGPKKKLKLPAFLVTEDERLWPEIGAQLPAKLTFRQIDSIAELLREAPLDTPAVVLWDARGCADKSAELTRIQSHSAALATLVLDDEESAWASAVQHGQIVAFVALPIDQDRLTAALAGAYDEANARFALLGEQSAVERLAGGGRRMPKRLIAAAIVICAAVLAAVLVSRRGAEHDKLAGPSPSVAKNSPADRPASAEPVSPASSPAPGANSAPATNSAPGSDSAPIGASSTASSSASEEKVEALIDQAQRAMRDRHFIEPAEGSALSLYRSALVLDPSSGEARQGLQRLGEVLLARVQTALDERQFDAALQALENARSIDPGDKRLAALDERIAKMRAELGPAEIQAAINAQNFDRASQLIDQAARAKSMSEPKLNQLREELRRHRLDSDAGRLVALIDARIQQDQLRDPPNDSAVYYLAQARKAGATSADLQTQFRELSRRLMQAARADIAQQHLDDADRVAGDLRSIGAPLSLVAGLQHDIGLARARASVAVADQPRYPELVRARLAQGSIVAPEEDSALHYLNQLKESDPQNASLPQLSKAVQAAIVAAARTALDASQTGQAESLLQVASSLGASPDIDALHDRLRNAGRPASVGPREVTEASLTRVRTLEIDYPMNALAQKIEGKVEVGYLVTPKGAVSDLKVLNSSPPGVFDKAAANAVSRLRYKPVLDGGKPVAVSTKMLVTFRVAK